MSRTTTFEFLGKTIGLTVQHEQGLSFVASSAGFHALEGLNFESLRQLEKAARALIDSDTSRQRIDAIRRWRQPTSLAA